jgi:hypothetical protein
MHAAPCWLFQTWFLELARCAPRAPLALLCEHRTCKFSCRFMWIECLYQRGSATRRTAPLAAGMQCAPRHCQSLETRTTCHLQPTNNYMSSAGERATAICGRKLHRRRNLPYSLRFLYCKTRISRLESAARTKRAATEGATHLWMRNLSGISTAGAAHSPVCSGRAVLDADFWEYT